MFLDLHGYISSIDNEGPKTKLLFFKCVLKRNKGYFLVFLKTC